MKTILIADSGSTKTDWLLMLENGDVIHEWTSQGINPFFQDKRAIRLVMDADVFPEIRTNPEAVFFYGAGCASPSASAPVKENLAEAFPQAFIEVESDLLGAARSVCQHSAGIACILGTGSNNCLYNGHQIIGNIGSLGFWMGDEGSGGYLGKQLVIQFLHRELPDDLSELFGSRFPEVNRMEILDRAYKQAFPNRYFAKFTLFIGEHQSHPYLRGLLGEAFTLFLDKYVVKHPNANSYPVCFVGAVAWHFKEILAEVVARKGLEMGAVIQRPMQGLARYHTRQD
jgi:glucosamine kinase